MHGLAIGWAVAAVAAAGLGNETGAIPSRMGLSCQVTERSLPPTAPGPDRSYVETYQIDLAQQTACSDDGCFKISALTDRLILFDVTNPDPAGLQHHLVVDRATGAFHETISDLNRRINLQASGVCRTAPYELPPAAGF